MGQRVVALTSRRMFTRKQAQALLSDWIQLHRPFDSWYGCTKLQLDIQQYIVTGYLPQVFLVNLQAEGGLLLATILQANEDDDELCAALEEYFGTLWRFEPHPLWTLGCLPPEGMVP
jgi:hypothetical protein